MGIKQRLKRVKRELAAKVDVTFTANPFRSLDRRFMILFASRSGSHLLCEGLREHGGVADGFFHLNRMERSGARTLQGYLETVIRKNTVAGTFGVKGGSYILAHLSLAGEFPDFISEWGIVYLTRQNVVRQAISRFVASQTGAWASSTLAKRILSDDDFDHAKIAGLVNACERVNTECERIFKTYGLTRIGSPTRPWPPIRSASPRGPRTILGCGDRRSPMSGSSDSRSRLNPPT